MNHHSHRIKSNHKKTPIDHLIYIVVFLSPLMTIPQIIEIYSRQSHEGVSVITWVSYTFISLVWLIYGLHKKDIPIVVSQIVWFIIYTILIAGFIMY